MDIFKDRIDPLILSSGKDASEIEKAIGLTRGTISKWRNTNLKSYLSYIEKIADYFGVSIAYIFGETDEKSPSPDEDRLSAFDAQIIDFVHHLSPEKLRGILLALDAPKELLDALDREARQE